MENRAESRRPIRVLFLIRSLDHGGAQRQLVTLATGMQAAGDSPVVMTFYCGGSLEESLRAAGVPVVSLEKRGRWDVLGFGARLIRNVRRQKLDVVHGYIDISNILVTLLRPFFGPVRIVWGIRSSNVDLDRYDWLRRAAVRIESMLSRFPDLIICNSRAGRAHALARGFPVEKTVAIPNGIDTDVYRPDAEAGQVVRQEWGIGGTDKLVGLVARLDTMKDHPTFLKAASLIAGDFPEARFVCVGGGPSEYRGQLQDLAAELGLTEHLSWVGERDDTPAVYNALNVSCLTSVGEGFPNAVGEAMACGVPCIVTDVGDSAWIVADTGVVVPPGDPRALADGCMDVIRRLDESGDDMRKSARARIVREFSKQALVERTADALDNLVTQCAES